MEPFLCCFLFNLFTIPSNLVLSEGRIMNTTELPFFKFAY